MIPARINPDLLPLQTCPCVVAPSRWVNSYAGWYEFKAKVALEAPRGEQGLAELSAERGIY